MRKSFDKLAVISPFIGVFGFCISSTIYLLDPGSLPYLNILTPFIMLLSFSFFTLIAGISSKMRIKKNRMTFRGIGFSISAIVIGSIELGFLLFIYLILSGRLGAIY